MRVLDDKEISKRLRAIREEKDWSARKFAIEAEVDPSQYSKIEKAELPITENILDKLISRYGIDKEYVLYGRGNNVPHGTSTAASKSIRKPKIAVDENADGITFIPISAQGGYSRRVLDPVFNESLEKLYIPGFPYRGERYRIWEVEGNSMEPTFKEGFYVLTEKIEDWKNIKDWYAYVIVTVDSVLLKRVHPKNKNEWILVSDNEDLYPQFILPMSEVKELWFVKRKMDWEMAPPKRFEIKV